MSEREVHQATMEFDDGNSMHVWLVHDLIDVNGVLGNLRILSPKEIHLVPPPPLSTASGFTPGYTEYGVTDAGYTCPKCGQEVQGGLTAGTAQSQYRHRFDYCQCLMVLRHPESEWNLLLTALECWELCLKGIDDARQADSKRN